MGTRALIGMQYTNGNIRAIYCHWDGYIEGGVGETLHRHYQDTAKINQLLDGGDISGLGSRIDAPEAHSFENPVEDCTVFYIRNRGKKGCAATSYPTAEAFMASTTDCMALYAYLYVDGAWLVGRRGVNLANLRPLAGYFEAVG